MDEQQTSKRDKVDPNVRLLGQVMLGTFLWVATFLATHSGWLTRQESIPARAALVAVGVGGFVPMIFVYAKSIRMQDEFNQRLHLMALGVAFATIGALSYAIDLLHTAHFIEQPSSFGLWGVMVAVWFASMIVVPRFYR